ncbi:MAG TPA: glycosyltransferase family 2 protein [Candidatus Paceibacterota bacterium]|nr:glycosyltransferase family 2 protein [Candidatus Paceibacterota bacterium]
MKVAVVIPTYNEAGAIGNLFNEMAGVFAAAPEHEWYVVIVDANSPDGTADIVRAKAKQYANIRLLVETGKRGIGPAYVTGMRYALDDLHADAFVEFDGDGQHDPRDIVRLVERLDAGADYAIGSRYVAGGTIPREWAVYRKILSRFGSLYARILLELPVYDATSGLKATQTSVAKHLPLGEGELLSNQYAYKLQFLYALSRANVRIVEIPIVFRIREHDISKSAWYDILESLRLTLLMRLHTLSEWRFLRVVAIGGISFLLQAAIFEIVGIQLHLLEPSEVATIAGLVAIFVNFALHERYSFKDKRDKAAPLLQRFSRFAVLSLSSVFLQWALVAAAARFIGEEAIYLRGAYILAVSLGLVVNYIGFYFWVWARARRKTIPSAL